MNRENKRNETDLDVKIEIWTIWRAKTAAHAKQTACRLADFHHFSLK